MSNPKQSRSNKSYVRKGKSAGRNNYSKSKKVDEADVHDKHNDAAWYVANGELAQNVASFSFNEALGDPIMITGFNGINSYKVLNRVPGIMSILTVPAIGATNSNSAPINVAMRNIYSYVRHANSGHSNYDPADLMLYLLSMDSVYTFWSYLTRIYGVCHTFSKVNRYYGDALLSGMGVNAPSIRANLSDFRAFINMYAVKASAFAVPKTMPYFVRHSWMYSNVYKDEDVAKSQLYMYVPGYLHQYSIDEETGLGMLQTVPIAAHHNSTGAIDRLNSLTYADLVLLGNQLLDRVMLPEDIGIMSGDVLKAFGPENLWSLTPVPEDYTVLPVFSEEVLTQIHNTTFGGAAPCSSIQGDSEPAVSYNGAFDIKQDPAIGGGGLAMYTSFKASARIAPITHILDFNKDNPTAEDILVASRNKISSGLEARWTDKGISTIEACGSEIPILAFIGTSTGSDASYTRVFGSDTEVLDPAIYTKFRGFPLFYTITGGTTPNRNTPTGIVGSMDTYTVMDDQSLQNLHNSALLSLFGVPYVK